MHFNVFDCRLTPSLFMPISNFAHQSFTVSEIGESEQEPKTFQTYEVNSFTRTISQRDITDQARIGASSSKNGHFAENLRVVNLDDVNKTWQSDGYTPHYIVLELDKQTLISELRFYLDIKSDESYTPRTVTLQLGNSLDDLTDFATVLCDNPQGWICIDLSGAVVGKDQRSFPDFARARVLRLVMTSNYQLGRDSRIRGIRLFTPDLPASYHRHCDSYLQKYIKKVL